MIVFFPSRSINGKEAYFPFRGCSRPLCGGFVSGHCFFPFWRNLRGSDGALEIRGDAVGAILEKISRVGRRTQPVDDQTSARRSISRAAKSKSHIASVAQIHPVLYSCSQLWRRLASGIVDFQKRTHAKRCAARLVEK